MSGYRASMRHFEEVALYGAKRGKCLGGCGRMLRRQRRFFQTLSPFNKNADGELKSRSEIYAELREQRAAWQDMRETCQECRS